MSLKLLKIRRIFAFSIFILSVSSQKLKPEYEKSNDKLKIFKIGQQLSFQCKPEDPQDGEKIVWKKNREPIDDEHNEIKYDKKNGKLIIDRSRDEHAGNYSCHLNEESHTFDAWAQSFVKVSTEAQYIEEETAVISCVVRGTEPTIKWFYRAENQTDFLEFSPSDDRINFTSDYETGGRFANITLYNSKLSDRGVYRCNATNFGMTMRGILDASDEKMLRIKDKFAPLWPALGIVAQLVVLGLIIVVSERRRNQNEVDESDTDEGPEKKEEANFIRHRN